MDQAKQDELAKRLLGVIGQLVIILGELLPRDVDPATGRDKRTGSKLEESNDD